ncbi:MAG: DNA gyrase inhibitor YacG [Polymorphobacter sp.]|uniref:DNA gyrase inhibitor YacG n=1 Tax=Polymorphobacter sp. TaxID=1909290 RepID=UPI003A8BC998
MSAESPPEPAPKCAYCLKRPRTPAYAPFCSKGCADRDLLHWLGETYKLPDNTPLDTDEDPV